MPLPSRGGEKEEQEWAPGAIRGAFFFTHPASCTIAAFGMLVHIETGYEGKFDFAARQQKPELAYLRPRRCRAPGAPTSATCCGVRAALARRSNI